MQKSSNKFAKLAVLCACIICLTGCSKLVTGYRFPEYAEGMKPVIGETTKTNLLRNFGSPTAYARLGNPKREILLYGTETYYSYLFVRKNVVKRHVVAYYINDQEKLYEIADIEGFPHGATAPMTRVDIKLQKPNKRWTLPLYLLV